MFGEVLVTHAELYANPTMEYKEGVYYSNDSGDEILDCETYKSVLMYIIMKKLSITRACQMLKI